MLNAATDCVICVDLQNDFLPGGSLAAEGGDKIIRPIYEFLRRVKSKGVCVVATRDYHPREHVSFQKQGGPWPEHCVAGTEGAEYATRFPVELVDIEIKKGVDARYEAYSGFEGTDLTRQLHEKGVRRVLSFGLTTEYCVFSTAKDAKDLGFESFVVADLCAEVVPADKDKTLLKLQSFGVEILCSSQYH
jgi:nicotinamidase/pyrazinamidase